MTTYALDVCKGPTNKQIGRPAPKREIGSNAFEGAPEIMTRDLAPSRALTACLRRDLVDAYHCHRSRRFSLFDYAQSSQPHCPSVLAHRSK